MIPVHALRQLLLLQSRCIEFGHMQVHNTGIGGHGWQLSRSRGSATMCSTELHAPNGNSIAPVQLASHTTPMSGTELSAAASDLLASILGALLSSSMLYTKLGRRLSRLVAAVDGTATAASMRSTKV